MLSLSYPTQAHANFGRLKNLIELVGFKKSIFQLAERTPGRGAPGTAQGDTNIIINNHFDFAAFRNLTFSQKTQKATVESVLFESMGHAFQMCYASNLSVLASTADPQFKTIPHPQAWGDSFGDLRRKKEPGFFYGSPVEIWPVSGRDVLDGQACFSQLQYLAFASGGKLGWDDFRALGILHGVYAAAFEEFLRLSGLDWPPVVNHPTVALFLLICDMAINSGSGFPHPLVHFPTFISDTDPGARFTMMSVFARTTCPEVAGMITQYSRAEYEAVCEVFAKAMLVDSPLAVAATCAKWAAADGPFSSLMQEYATYRYQAGNQPVRVMFSHFLAFMEDKLATPEIFCWPGAWMAGSRVNLASVPFSTSTARCSSTKNMTTACFRICGPIATQLRHTKCSKRSTP